MLQLLAPSANFSSSVDSVTLSLHRSIHPCSPSGVEGLRPRAHSHISIFHVLVLWSSLLSWGAISVAWLFRLMMLGHCLKCCKSFIECPGTVGILLLVFILNNMQQWVVLFHFMFGYWLCYTPCFWKIHTKFYGQGHRAVEG